MLSWYSDQPNLRSQARNMVSRHCRDLPDVKPRIVQELSEHIAREGTTAAKVLRPARSASSAAGERSREHSGEQPIQGEPSTQNMSREPSQNKESSQGQRSSGGQESTRTPPLSQDQGPSSNEPSNESGIFWGFLSNVFERVKVDLGPNGFNLEISAGEGRSRARGNFPYPGTSSQRTSGASNHAHASTGHAILERLAQERGDNPNWQTSVVDLLKLQGRDSGPVARQQMARDLGINVGPDGSPEQNDALRRALMKSFEKSGRWK
jgi:hypothetical protein